MLKFGEEIYSSRSISFNFRNEKMPRGSRQQKLFVLEQLFLYILFGLSFLSCVRQAPLNSIGARSRSAHYRTVLPSTCSFQYPLQQWYPLNSNSFTTNNDINAYIYIAAHLGNREKDQRNRPARALDSAKLFHPCKSPRTSPRESCRSHRHHFTDTISPTREHCNATWEPPTPPGAGTVCV